MLSDEEKKAIEGIKKDDEYYDILENIKQNKYNMWNVEKLMRDTTTGDYTEYEIAQSIVYFVNIIEKQSKEIEELKASHITTNNKATNTEKAKIFDVIENSIDTYIEKSKPYWEQIMTKDEMTIEEALTIIDDMYKDRYKIMSQKTEKETIVDLSKMDYIKFTNLEWASVRVLREVQSLRHEMEKQSKEIEELKKYEKYYEEMEEVNKKFIAVDKIKAKIEEVKDGTYDAKIVLQSLLNEEE